MSCASLCNRSKLTIERPHKSFDAVVTHIQAVREFLAAEGSDGAANAETRQQQIESFLGMDTLVERDIDKLIAVVTA